MKKNSELLALIEKQVNATALVLSTWQMVRWQGGRLYYETTNINYEIKDYNIETQILYLECLQKRNFIIQDNLPSSAPVIINQFRS